MVNFIKKLFWVNGNLIEEEKCNISLDSLSLNWGLTVIEGINLSNSALFRIDDHIDRFIQTIAELRLKNRFSKKHIREGIIDVIKKNKLKDAYIRLIAYSNVSFDKLKIEKLSFNIAIIFKKRRFFIKYFKKKIKIVPILLDKEKIISQKIAGKYLEPLLSFNHAISIRYDDVLFVNNKKEILETLGANIVLIKNNIMYTPISVGIVKGITLNTINHITKYSKIQFIKRKIYLSEIEKFDDCYICGTYLGILRVKKIGKITLKNNSNVFTKTRDMYYNIINGKDNFKSDWLLKVIQ